MTQIQVDYTTDVQENEDGTKRIWFKFDLYPEIKFTYENIKFQEYDEDDQIARLTFDLDYQFQVSDESIRDVIEEKIGSEEFQLQVNALLADIIHELVRNDAIFAELEKN